MVFYNHPASPAPQDLPRYLDLGLYAACHGAPFTVSSNLVSALHAALTRFDARRFDVINALSSWLRAQLIASGLRLVCPLEYASPAVITIAVPTPIRSERVGDELLKSGYLLSYGSDYLLARNWVQVCLMGECDRAGLAPLIGLLAGCCAPRFPARIAFRSQEVAR
jgi:aspartate aminotransferase-like enzyme